MGDFKRSFSKGHSDETLRLCILLLLSKKIEPRVDRVLGFFSSPNWDSPSPSPAGECVPPPLVPGGTHSLAGEGVGVPI